MTMPPPPEHIIQPWWSPPLYFGALLLYTVVFHLGWATPFAVEHPTLYFSLFAMLPAGLLGLWKVAGPDNETFFHAFEFRPFIQTPVGQVHVTFPAHYRPPPRCLIHVGDRPAEPLDLAHLKELLRSEGVELSSPPTGLPDGIYAAVRWRWGGEPFLHLRFSPNFHYDSLTMAGRFTRLQDHPLGGHGHPQYKDDPFKISPLPFNSHEREWLRIGFTFEFHPERWTFNWWERREAWREWGLGPDRRPGYTTLREGTVIDQGPPDFNNLFYYVMRFGRPDSFRPPAFPAEDTSVVDPTDGLLEEILHRMVEGEEQRHLLLLFLGLAVLAVLFPRLRPFLLGPFSHHDRR